MGHTYIGGKESAKHERKSKPARKRARRAKKIAQAADA
jgi:hypothetical protein